MKVTIPEKEVEICDFCRREGTLQECPVCGKSYCLICHGTIPGCWVGPHVCKECAKREDVRRVVGRYADQLTPILKKRKTALKRLPKERRD